MLMEWCGRMMQRLREKKEGKTEESHFMDGKKDSGKGTFERRRNAGG